MFEDRSIAQLKQRQLEIAQSILNNPPSDYAGFLSVVGQYRGLQEAIDILTNVLRGDDNL